jgi:hypothetical protein
LVSASQAFPARPFTALVALHGMLADAGVGAPQQAIVAATAATTASENADLNGRSCRGVGRS